MGNSFATLTLAGSGLARAPRVKPAFHEDGYLERFDDATLWLDAVWRAGRVRLICPRLNNLATDLRRARFTLDDRPVRARMRHYDRHSVITLPARQVPSRVAVEVDGWRGETPVNPAVPDFDGRNVLVTLSKDNDPAWIEDWTRWHVARHGADAVLFVDNGSAEHDAAVIRPALLRAGVAVAQVLTTTAPYGPRGKKPYANAELFLQFCVLNAVRHRFLWHARAVLNCDVDELVDCAGAIFDRAVAARAGYVAFPGVWVHPAPGLEQKPYHRDHTHMDTPAKPCPDKWCMVPSGLLRGFEWRQHRLERLPFPGLFRDPEARFYHCRRITNGWKITKRTRVRDDTVADPALQEAVEVLPQRRT